LLLLLVLLGNVLIVLLALVLVLGLLLLLALQTLLCSFQWALWHAYDDDDCDDDNDVWGCMRM